jgi:cysteinyl-tRNA synthetase
VSAVAGVSQPAEALEESPPDGDPEAWALEWARRRATAKRARNFAEADRIRSLLAGHGWEVRDRKDGGIEVTRK